MLALLTCCDTNIWEIKEILNTKMTAKVKSQYSDLILRSSLLLLVSHHLKTDVGGLVHYLLI